MTLHHVSKSALAITVIALSILFVGCERAPEGAVLIETNTTGIVKIVRPKDGNVGYGWYTEYHSFNTKANTFEEKVGASTKDNAAVEINIQVTATPPETDDDIKAYARKFGFTEEALKEDRLGKLVRGQINTETKNAVAQYEAYGLLANQGAIQQSLMTALSKILKEQAWLRVDSIQIINRPDFLDDRIENAASAVVANQKAQEAAQAALQAAKVEAERKEVEAKTFANPAMLELEKYRIANQAQVEIERARAEGMARHSGTLTVVNGGSSPQLQLKQ